MASRRTTVSPVLSLRRQAGRAVGQPRRDARRRSGVVCRRRSSGCARFCGRRRSAPSGTTRTRPRSSKASSPDASTRSRRCCTTARSTSSRSSTSPNRSTARSSRRRSTSRLRLRRQTFRIESSRPSRAPRRRSACTTARPCRVPRQLDRPGQWRSSCSKSPRARSAACARARCASTAVSQLPTVRHPNPPRGAPASARARRSSRRVAPRDATPAA